MAHVEGVEHRREVRRVDGAAKAVALDDEAGDRPRDPRKVHRAAAWEEGGLDERPADALDDALLVEADTPPLGDVGVVALVVLEWVRPLAARDEELEQGLVVHHVVLDSTEGCHVRRDDAEKYGGHCVVEEL